MKNSLIVCCFFLTIGISAQNLNKYKYVLVPEKFEFLKNEDQYRLNGLTHFLFNKYGFTAFLGKKDAPLDAVNNNCLNLFAEVISASNMFITKLAIQLKDCRGRIVYTTPFASSKEKSFKVAYNKALRSTAEHLETLKYKYDGQDNIDFEIEKEVPLVINKTNKLVKIDSISSNLNKDKQDLENKRPTKFYAHKIQKEGWVDFNLVDKKGVLYYVLYSTGKEDTYLVEQTKHQEKMLCFKNKNLWYLVSRDQTNMVIKTIEIQFEK